MVDAITAEIRWMIRIDMPEVIGIEQDSFEFPWSEEDFNRTLENRNCICSVAVYEDEIVGFMVYELNKQKISLLSFAVRPDLLRRTVGRQLMEALLGKLLTDGMTRISLEVRETNLRAQKFFREMGFKATSLLRSHYEETEEDAYAMNYYLGGIEEPTATSTNRIGRLA